MRRIGLLPGNRAWIWTSLAGLAVFLLVQVFPAAWGYIAGESKAISREAAGMKAAEIAGSLFGWNGNPESVEITHLSDSAAIGYLSKEKKLKAYKEEWADKHPADVYRADLPAPGGEAALTLLLQMESGQLVGWRDADPVMRNGETVRQAPEDAAKRALSFAAFRGVIPADWEWNGEPADDEGRIVFHNRKSGLAEAGLELVVQVPPGYDLLSSAVPPWKNGSVTYDIQVPEAFTAYLEEQRSLAGKLNAFGFIVPQLLLLIFSLICAVSLRGYTSLKRGLLLAIIFAVMYGIFYFNMMPGFRAGLLEEGLAADRSSIGAVMAANMIVLACMAAFTYLSAVGGDGLWRSMGRPLWPRWRDPDFGDAVVSGVRTGYLLAFLLLGVQSIILLGLQYGIGMFMASDASQSTYNMSIPWLLLLLAWCAGISEELQSRLFGIGLFRSGLLSGAERVFGRKPGPRAAAGLTFAAMIPPGLIWAFGHVGYAVYPAYSRLIELVIMGLLFGWFLLRFGLIAVLFAHVILDSILMATQLSFDGLPGNLPAGLAGIVLPAVVGWAIWRAHRKWGGRPHYTIQP